MSTARTTLGCLAEDYASDMATVCAVYVESKHRKVAAGYVLDIDEQRRVDVAESFILVSKTREVCANHREGRTRAH